MKNDLVLSHASSRRGADLGRPDNIPDCVRKQERVKLHLVKLKWVDGDYDQGGAYWGRIPDYDIYCAHAVVFNPVSNVPFPLCQIFVWARNRENAKKQVQVRLLNAKFYR